MSKQDYCKACKKAYELPRLAVGDVLLVGKFKNRKATITGFSSDENNQPVAQTDKGDQKIFKPRIAKLMPAMCSWLASSRTVKRQLLGSLPMKTISLLHKPTRAIKRSSNHESPN